MVGIFFSVRLLKQIKSRRFRHNENTFAGMKTFIFISWWIHFGHEISIEMNFNWNYPEMEGDSFSHN